MNEDIYLDIFELLLLDESANCIVSDLVVTFISILPAFFSNKIEKKALKFPFVNHIETITWLIKHLQNSILILV